VFRVLLATDGSAYALKAAEFAGKLCQQIPDSQITVIHVIDTTLLAATMAPPTGVGVPATIILPREVERMSERALEAARDLLTAQGHKVATRVENGNPAEVICRIAEKESFDLIAMGHRGMGRLAGILLGSVTDKVVHRSRVPVLIVRSNDKKEEAEKGKEA